MEGRGQNLLPPGMPRAIALLVACLAVILGSALGFRPGTILIRALVAGVATEMVMRVSVSVIHFVGITVTEEE